MIRHRRWIGLTALVAVLISLMAWVVSGAVWDETKAVQFTAAKYDRIEESTLLLGTHPVHRSAHSAALDEVAKTTTDQAGTKRRH